MLDFIIENVVNFICYCIENPKAFIGVLLMTVSLTVLSAITFFYWI
jgi:hypothetical protein